MERTSGVFFGAVRTFRTTVVLHDVRSLPAEDGSGEVLFGYDNPASIPDTWDRIPLPADVDRPVIFEGTGKCLFESPFTVHEPEPIQVLDPQNREYQWRSAAIEVDFKRLCIGLHKFPWKLEGSTFRPRDRWHGTGFAACDKLFALTTVGTSDVLASQVVVSRSGSDTMQSVLPVIPISLKKARREPCDEDMRRKALLSLWDLFLKDPLATKLDSSLCGQLEQGGIHEDVERSVRVVLRMKASSILQKRAASWWKRARYLSLYGTANFKPELDCPHSCKTTLLTWAGRCVRVPFSSSERRLLGHVLDPSVKSVLCYSRESCAMLYTKVLCMFRMIRAGEFSPDLSAIERVVQLADAAGEVQQSGRDEWADDPAQLDSDLSAALVVTDAGDVRIDVQ